MCRYIVVSKKKSAKVLNKTKTSQKQSGHQVQKSFYQNDDDYDIDDDKQSANDDNDEISSFDNDYVADSDEDSSTG